jgi:hypothetical protein
MRNASECPIRDSRFWFRSQFLFLARLSAAPSSPSATVGHRLIKPHSNSEWCDFDSGARGHSAAVFDFIEEALDLALLWQIFRDGRVFWIPKGEFA